MENLADALQKEISRNIDLIDIYNSIGPMGNFAKGMIKLDIDNATKAAIGSDVVEMLKWYNTLKNNE